MNVKAKKKEILDQIENTGIWNELLSMKDADSLYSSLNEDEKFNENFTTHLNYEKQYIKGKIIKKVDFTVKKKYIEPQTKVVKFTMQSESKNITINEVGA